MTNKIPVGATIAQTYRFAFVNFLNNLAATWMPQVLLLAAGFFIGPLYAPSLMQMQRIPPGYAPGAQGAAAAATAMQNNMRVLGAALPLMLLVFGITFICLSAMAATLTRNALVPQQGRSYFQFPFGPPAFRLMGAYVLAVLALIALYIGTLLVTAVVAGAVTLLASAGPGGKILVGLATGVTGIIAFCALIYIGVRLSFLITPSVVAEERVTLARGWRLTHGNFWRIIAVGLVVWLPVFLAYGLLIGFIMSNLGLPPTHPGMTPAEAAAWSQQLNTRVLGLVNSYRQSWFVTYPAAIVVTTVVYGLACGLSAFAYRALAPEPDREAAAFS